MEKKIRTELLKMTGMILVLLGLGIYARDFVWTGIQAKMALNLSIFGLFGLAAWLGFRHVLDLKNEVIALNALKADFDPRARKRGDTIDMSKPAVVFHQPELLGEGYRLITEELGKQSELQITNGTVQSLLHEVDLRINDRKSTLIYFSGLMVFLGLLGAFMGLMKTVHSVSDLIGSMDMSGKGGTDAFAKMIEGMKAPLSGMSVGFSSSLFGLMTSMVLGALERCMTSAMKTLRNEFEHWISKLAALETASNEGATSSTDESGLRRVLEAGTRQLQELRELASVNVANGLADKARIDKLQDAVTTMAATMDGMTAAIVELADPTQALEPIVVAVEQLAAHQAAVLVNIRALHGDAAADRENLRGLVKVMEVAIDRLQAQDGPELHGQLDRLFLLQAQIAAQPNGVAIGGPAPLDPVERGPWAWLGQWRANRRIESQLRAQRRAIGDLGREIYAALDGNRRTLRTAGRLVGRRLDKLAQGRDLDRRQMERLASLTEAQRAELGQIRERLATLPETSRNGEGSAPYTGGRALLQSLRERLNVNFEADTAKRVDRASHKATGTYE
jgi:hypothetical protein